MLVLEDIVGFHKNHSTSASSELLVVEKTLITMMATPFILRDSYRVVDIRVLYKGI